MISWFYEKIFIEKLDNALGFVLLSLFSVGLAFFVAITGFKENMLALALLAGIPVGVICLFNHKIAFYLLIIVSVLMMPVNRVLTYYNIIYLQLGTLLDGVLALVFLLILLKDFQQFFLRSLNKQDFSYYRHPISILVFIWVSYSLLQFFNPSGNVYGWIYGIRDFVRMLMIYFIAVKIFDNFKSFKEFTDFFLFIGLIVAAYGLYQEFAGLPAFDLRWAGASEERINLLFIQGKWRKFSMLTDPAVFGLFMSLISILSGILSLRSNSLIRRSFYLITCVASIAGMLYSGTRTAYAILPIAFVFYVLLNITNKRVLLLCGISIVMFLVLLFGPFYGKTIVRFRSAFNPSEDASMQLRDMNRERIQPYIYAHPLGGGLATTGAQGMRYNPRHPLAGFPPDSGFMKTLLELGWIGLFLELTLYTVLLTTGIMHFYSSKPSEMRDHFIAYLIAFFSLTIAYYAKKSVDQFPINFFLFSMMAIAVNYRKIVSSSEDQTS